MKKIEIIRKEFSCLSDFEFSCELKKPGYECVFKNDDNVKVCLSESEDYRDENRIDFVLKKGTKILFSFYYKPMVNHCLIGVDEMVSSVNGVYQIAKGSHRGFTNVHFEEVIQLFAKFVETNLSQILE